MSHGKDKAKSSAGANSLKSVELYVLIFLKLYPHISLMPF